MTETGYGAQVKGLGPCRYGLGGLSGPFYPFSLFLTISCMYTMHCDRIYPDCPLTPADDLLPLPLCVCVATAAVLCVHDSNDR